MAVFTSDFLNDLERLPEFQEVIPIESEEWFILRFYFYFANLRNGLKKGTRKDKVKAGVRSCLAILSFTPKLLLAPRGKKLLVTNNAEVVKLGSKVQQKLFFNNPLSEDSFLIEKFTVWQKPISRKNACSFLFIQILEKLFYRLYPLSGAQVQNCELIHSALSRFRKENMVAAFNAKKTLQRFEFYVFTWKILIWLLRPKEILLTDYHNVGNLALIKVAKEKGILVTELQHGVISYAHPAYFFNERINRSLTPDYLFFFLPLHNYKTKNFYIHSDNAIKVEHPLYYAFGSNEVYLKDLQDSIKDKYSSVLLFTLQDTSELVFSEIIIDVALEFPQFFFIILPRSVFSSERSIPDNVVIDWKHNFYELLQISDIHFTHYSTCALESKMLNVRNICIDLDKMASRYYVEQYNENSSDFLFIPGKEELVNYLNRLNP